MQEFQVSRAGTVIGKATLDFDGLYCTVRCLYNGTGEILRLVDRRATGDVSIGICGPINGVFGVEKKIPAKYMDGFQHNFVLVSRMEDKKKFYPLDEPIPVHVLKQPENCRYSVQNNKPGIVIENCQGYTHCCPSE